MAENYVLLNGRIVPSGAARIGAFDSGLSHGAGLFETWRVYRGRPFRLQAHLDRIAASAESLGLRWPADSANAWSIQFAQLLEANGLREARMRLTLTAGEAEAPAARRAESRKAEAADATQTGDAGEGASEAFSGTILITAGPVGVYPPELYERGMSVCISDYRVSLRDPIAGHKTLSYFPRLLGLREAQRKHCGEALWFSTDYRLTEGCISNVFVVKDDRLLTPPRDAPILPGVTRRIVLDLAAEAGIPAAETPLTIEDLLSSREVFLTNSIMEIMPVARIEKHAVADEKPGPITRRLRELYRETVERESRPSV